MEGQNEIVSCVPEDLVVDDVYKVMIERLVQGNDGLRNLIILPHWSYKWMEPPKGYVATLDADAPFTPDMFRCNMFQSTTVTVVSGDSTSRPKRNDAAILAATPRVSETPPPFPTVAADDACSVVSTATTSRVNMDWTPSLGDRGSYIGIYDTTFDCDATKHGERIIVCKAGVDATTYEEMEAFFDDQPDDATYRSVFNDRRIEKFKALLRYNRQRLVHAFATELGVSVRTRELADGTKLALHNFETVTNDIVLGSKDVTFYSDCARTSDVRYGLVVDRTPIQGPLVYMRPLRTPMGPWSNNMTDAFPTRIAQLNGLRSGKSQQHNDAALRRIIVSETKDVTSCVGSFCQRTHAWMECERLLGYDFNNVGECSPLIVRM